MRRRALVMSLRIMSGMSGCLRLESSSGGTQGGTTNTTGATTTNDVTLSQTKSLDKSLFRVWYDDINFYASGLGELTTLNPDGIRWQHSVDNYEGSRAFASQSTTAIFGFRPSDESADGAAAEFRAYNSADGSRKWTYTAPEDGVHINPRGATIVNSIAAVGSNRYGNGFEFDPLVTGIDFESGKIRWEHQFSEIDARYLSGIWEYDDQICVGLSSKGLVFLDPDSGERTGRRQDLQTLTTGGTVQAGKFYAAYDGQLKGFNLADGSEVWSHTIEGRSFIEPNIDPTLVVAGTRNGMVYAVSRANGNLLWEANVDDKVNSIATSTNHVWVLTSQGGLFGLTRTNGEIAHRSVRNMRRMTIGSDRLVGGNNNTTWIYSIDELG